MASERDFFGVSALLFGVSAAATAIEMQQAGGALPSGTEGVGRELAS